MDNPKESTMMGKEQQEEQKKCQSDSVLYVKKRKRRNYESIERPRKKKRQSSDASEGCSSSVSVSELIKTLNSAAPFVIGQKCEQKESPKRKSKEGTDEFRKRRKTSSDASEGCSQTPAASCTESSSHQTSAPADGPSTTLEHTAHSHSRDDFLNKYQRSDIIGKGAYGKVYKGYCKEDNRPVAIKHVPSWAVVRVKTTSSSSSKPIPVEVDLLLKLRPAEGTTNAVLTLLDWYDLDNELILVMERPEPSMDLLRYLWQCSSSLPESKAKIIIKQLVDALHEVHSKGVFHRDIKLENIILETGSDVPRVRLIDFGLGTYVTSGEYTDEIGTYGYLTPEYFRRGSYKAEPTTVWTVGVVTYEILHCSLPFRHECEIRTKKPKINDDLSDDCKKFIERCLSKNVRLRPTLASLKEDPWFK